MNYDWKSILEKVTVGALTAIVLGALTLFANWASQGGLVHALGGVTSKDLNEATKHFTVSDPALRDELQVVRTQLEAVETKLKAQQQPGHILEPSKPIITVTEAKFSPDHSFRETVSLLNYIKKICDDQPKCQINTTIPEFISLLPQSFEKIIVTHWCEGKVMQPSTKTVYGAQGTVLFLSCLEC